MSALIAVVAIATVAITLTALVFIALKLRARFRHLDKQLANLSLQIQREVDNRVFPMLDEKTREIQNTLALTQMGFSFPLFIGGWSIDAFLGRYLVDYLALEKPRTILELGSGSSTLLIARSLELLGHSDCKHIAVDHDAHFLALTRRSLELNGLDHRVSTWHCPLQSVAGTEKLWYGGLVERLSGEKIDLLLVDGPPGPLQEESRIPALPLLIRLLSDHCLVILDDASRAQEQSIARKWHAAYPQLSLEIIPAGHGMAILRRAPSDVD